MREPYVDSLRSSRKNQVKLWAVCRPGLMMDKTMHWAGGLWGQALAMPIHSCSKRNTCRVTLLASVVKVLPRLDAVSIEGG